MNTQKENPTFEVLWAEWEHFEPAGQKAILEQVYSEILSLPLEGVVEHLAGLADGFKERMWQEWGKRAELSGYTLQQIAALVESEPYHCVYGIIREWLDRADLSKYSLGQVKRMNLMLRHKADVITLWTRWTEQADMSYIGLEDLIKSVDDLAPEIMIVIIGAHKVKAGWKNYYGKDYLARLTSRLHLPPYVVSEVNKYAQA